ncbi:MAG: tyrosine-type recombinase/integrase [Gammaproteobacteria bacterium]|nr:tyrosine-type recombinase/integrase [Gammaproteobacteria bacterium]
MAHNRPLTAAFVRTVKRPGRYGDGGRGSFGLYLRVWHRPNGRVGKSWGQRITINGRRTNLGLGPAAFVTLAEARAKARENAGLAYQGRDPRGDGVPTVQRAAEKVIALHAKGWKPGSNLPSKWRQTFRDYVLPRIGSKPVGAVTTADVMAVLTPIWTTKPAAARIVRQRLGAVMKWAVAQGFREDNPAGDAITAALPKNGGHKHHKAVPHSEVADVLRKVRNSRRFQPSAQLALEFLVLTACRTSEVRGATWDEIDGDTWTIPVERMKGKREHRIPLSVRALAVLQDARELHDGDLVFPGRRTGGPLASTQFFEMLRKLGVAGTVHGFRTSFRSWAAEQPKVNRQVAELALAHRVRGVEGVYQRSDLLARRRDVMEQWARYIAS